MGTTIEGPSGVLLYECGGRVSFSTPIKNGVLGVLNMLWYLS